MIDMAARVVVWLLLSRRSEGGQTLGSFSMIVLFALVAIGIAFILVSSGVFETSGGGGQSAGIEQPNFQPPNPFE